MPFSFIDIEEKKSRVISFLFVFIILFYFLTAFLILFVVENYALRSEISFKYFFWPPLNHIAVIFLIALLVGFCHWTISTSNLIDKMSLVIGAEPLDAKDAYHQVFKNIVEEVSVAIGGTRLEPLVIPSAGMNAFALQDFNKRACIGVTEGLLARLSRSQLEAVVAHEAGHIKSGDCLSTTVICSLSEIYETILMKMNSGFRGLRGRGAGLAGLVYLVIGFMNFMSKLMRAFISRQREYRADALSVRLTRDPLSLAEALELISSRWRGEGLPEARMESIFIVNPKMNSLDDASGFISDVFSTHPPIDERIAILADMAHLTHEQIEERLKNFKRVSPVVSPETKSAEGIFSTHGRWSIFLNDAWCGPFSLEELMKIEAVKPDTWVTPEGHAVTKHAYEEGALIEMFKERGEKNDFDCPHCRAPLIEMSYEGAPFWRCSCCEGSFVGQDKISRILIRADKVFSDETLRLAGVVMKEKEKFNLGITRTKMNNAWILDCPKCRSKMRRQFFVYSYPIEIDRCASCDSIWFDKQELEILQYLYENKEEFFDGKGF
jgi:heat shock protein HtpX